VTDEAARVGEQTARAGADIARRGTETARDTFQSGLNTAEPDGRFIVSTEARQFVMTGFCGGYTTFSSFSLQTLNLVRDGEIGRAGANVVLSVLLCLLSVWLGHAVALSLNQLKEV